MRNSLKALFSLLLIGLINGTSGQNSNSSASPLADRLRVTVSPPSQALLALFPPNIVLLQTPIAVRYVLFTIVPVYEIRAACDSVALSFFGTKDSINPKFCSNENSSAEIGSLITYRLIASEFPVEAARYGRFLVENGLNPFNESTDKRTVAGWANFIAARLVNYFSNDGWNSQGDATRMDFRQRFSDSSGYTPSNQAYLGSLQLRRPLRWQPLTGAVDGRGNFASQVHITPHLGSSAKPLVLTETELKSRRVGSPYASPNKWSKLSSADEKKMSDQIKSLLRRNRELTTKQVALAFWWDSKFVSLGALLGFYQAKLKYDAKTATLFFLGDMMAQHDAILLVWKEKVKHDLVRPTTIIRRLLHGKKFIAYKGFGKGVGLVKSEEWEPLVPVQPHSEFPSASATLCASTAEFLQLALRSVVGPNGTIPPFETTLQPGAVPFSPVDVPIEIKFPTLSALGRNCGQSRLNAGVHFEPSVSAGQKLATGLGQKAFEHVSMLFSGRVPKGCSRCIKDKETSD